MECELGVAGVDGHGALPGAYEAPALLSRSVQQHLFQPFQAVVHPLLLVPIAEHRWGCQMSCTDEVLAKEPHGFLSEAEAAASPEVLRAP